MMNETCKECEERGHCERTLSIGEFLKRLMETHSVPVIHECPLHRKWEEYEERRIDMEQLKPCPFCGGVAGIEKRQENSVNEQHKVVTVSERYKIRCRNCGCGTYWSFYEDIAIKAWNRREEAEKALEGME